jgi:hypothetical protein
MAIISDALEYYHKKQSSLEYSEGIMLLKNTAGPCTKKWEREWNLMGKERLNMKPNFSSLFKDQSTERYGWVEIKLQDFLHFLLCRWMSSFTLCRLYLRGNILRYPLLSRLHVPHSCVCMYMYTRMHYVITFRIVVYGKGTRQRSWLRRYAKSPILTPMW